MDNQRKKSSKGEIMKVYKDFQTRRFERLDAAERINENFEFLAEQNEVTIETLSTILDVLKHQEERIEMLIDIIHELAPEYEIIETAAETDEERQEMVNKYMNHNMDYMG